jgi:hypothetical protein
VQERAVGDDVDFIADPAAFHGANDFQKLWVEERLAAQEANNLAVDSEADGFIQIGSQGLQGYEFLFLLGGSVIAGSAPEVAMRNDVDFQTTQKHYGWSHAHQGGGKHFLL